MPKLPRTAALILIDVQRGFADGTRGERNNPAAEGNVASLLAGWRRTARPVRHVRHISSSPGESFWPGTSGHDFKPEAMPIEDEPVFGKTVNSGFIGTSLEASLRGADVGTVVIAGLTTNHCVSTTARMAGNLGFETYIVADACATFGRPTVEGACALRPKCMKRP